MRKLHKLHFVTIGILITITNVFVLSKNIKANEGFFTRNNIIFYDKDGTLQLKKCQDGSNVGTIKNFSDLRINQKGKEYLKTYGNFIKQKITEKTQFNDKTRQQLYIEAVTKVGMPAKAWIFLAVIDLNERNYRTDRSVLNGIDSFGALKGTDGVPPGKDYIDDLRVGANHFYGKIRYLKFNMKNNEEWTLDNIANALLMYNRHSMYFNHGLTWRDSGYVNNFSDSYSNNGKLDSQKYCAIAQKHGYRCDHNHSKLGTIHVFNFINNGFSLNQNNSTNSTSADNINEIVCEEFDEDSGIDNSKFKGSLKSLYDEFAWPSNCRGRTRNANCDATKPKNKKLFKSDVYKQAGSSRHTDCGVWVAFMIRSSGIDPNYNKKLAVTSQLYNNFTLHNPSWKLVGYGHTPGKPEITISQLQAGDVAVTNGHTWMYLGNGLFTSASLNERYPMKGHFIEGGGKPTKWYRKAN